MELRRVNINCLKEWKNSNRTKLFSTIKYTFDYTAGDKRILDSLIEKGKRLANKVNPSAANDSFKSRSQQRIMNNCIAGIIAEYCWRCFLNDEGKVQRVQETEFTNASIQIDLQTIKSHQTIEVRSSFPRNGISFAVCHPKKEFDIIGPYSNSYKPGEIKKNFYLRALFHLKQIGIIIMSNGKKLPKLETILEKVYQPQFELYLTGGADWEMMTDDSISINKTFIPEDEINLNRINQATDFRVVPFHKALDSIEIYHRIKSIEA